MDNDTKQKLSEAGVDIKVSLDRLLGNEELMIRFLKMFPDDNNYGLLKDSIEKKDYKSAFNASHTLKGLCGNLSLNSLYELMEREVELLRNGIYDEADELFPKIQSEYEKVIDIIRSI